MEINWEVVTCLVIGFFAITGFSRGWWKEGLTTTFLIILFVLLQRPDWAESFINFVNDAINTIWSFIPDSIAQIFTNQLFVTAQTSTPPIQADPTSPGTWVVILILFIAASIFLGRFWLSNAPTTQGSLLGFLVGAANGFLVLNLVREYLDGRSLPGSTAEVVSAGVGGTVFSPPVSSVAIQATDLPNFTILDSNVPWVIIIGGILIVFAVLKTRFRILERNGMRKLSFRELPPFHARPVPKKSEPKRVTLEIP